MLYVKVFRTSTLLIHRLRDHLLGLREPTVRRYASQGGQSFGLCLEKTSRLNVIRAEGAHPSGKSLRCSRLRLLSCRGRATESVAKVLKTPQAYLQLPHFFNKGERYASERMVPTSGVSVGRTIRRAAASVSERFGCFQRNAAFVQLSSQQTVRMADGATCAWSRTGRQAEDVQKRADAILANSGPENPGGYTVNVLAMH